MTRSALIEEFELDSGLDSMEVKTMFCPIGGYYFALKEGERDSTHLGYERLSFLFHRMNSLIIDSIREKDDPRNGTFFHTLAQGRPTYRDRVTNYKKGAGIYSHSDSEGIHIKKHD